MATGGFGLLFEDRGQHPMRKGEMQRIHCKKRFAIFLSPAGMSLTKLSLDGNNLIIPAKGEFGQGHPGWGRENR
jgi:hypothetical protein